MIRPRDVCLGWVHGGTVRAEFMDSVLGVLAGSPLPARYVTFTAGPHLAAARNAVAGLFLEHGPEGWLWMVDTDTVFDPGVLTRLAAAADERDRLVVSGLYWTTTAGGAPLVPMLFDRRPGQTPEFTPVDPARLTGDVIPVDGCGAGCLLIHRRVLEDIAKKAGSGPWFTEIRDGGREYGEDLSFCLRAAQAGHQVHAAPAARVGHVKPVVLGPAGPTLEGAELTTRTRRSTRTGRRGGPL